MYYIGLKTKGDECSMKKVNIFICSLIFTLIISTALPNFAHASELNSKGEALTELILYNFKTKKLEFDDKIAQEKYNFTNEEINYYEYLETLTSEEVNTKFLELGIDMENYDGDVIYKEDEEGELTKYGVVAWLVGIGFVSIVGYFFWDRYLTHKEKMNYMNKCFAQGGNPVIDSRDNAGLDGTTDAMAAQKIGGYNFACKRP